MLFLALIALDRLSTLTPIHLQPVAPWNPLVGICVAIAVADRRRGVLLAFTAAMLSGLVASHTPISMMLAALNGLVASALTGGISTLARRVSRRSSHYLVKNRVVSVMLVSPFIVALVGIPFTGALAILRIIAADEMAIHLMRFWVGVVVAIVIFVPLLTMYWVPGPREPLTFVRTFEALAQAAVVIAAVWLGFGENPQTASRYLFVVFLPMIWIVLRFGVRGAIAMNALVQTGMITSLLLAEHEDVNATLFQALVLVLSASGILFGLAVDQSKSVSLQLRARDEEISAGLRVGTTGELAGTLAHELGHPLGAISNYAAALNHILRKVAPNNADATLIAAKLGQEILRATDTLQRIREFFRSGKLTLERTDLGAIVKEAMVLLKDRLGYNGISPCIVLQGGSPVINCDHVQLRAVVYNLLVNAIDALKSVKPESRELSVTLTRLADQIRLDVEDSGGGVATDVRGDIFEPLVTTKSDGLGLGLTMSRSVVTAHGGTIELGDSKLGGARFIITLPANGGGENDHITFDRYC
ncbi:MAG: ATP-binding protein [Rhodospirillaceae bacterium]